jgi:peroxiredoxin
VVATYQKYHDKGFDVVGISLDSDKSALQDFTKQNGMVWPQYFESSGGDNKFAVQYGVPYIPTMWLVGKDGNILTTNARDDLAGQVAAALKK